MCNEYLIEVVKNGEVTHLVQVERDKSISIVIANATNYKYVNKFRVKANAEKVAQKVQGARVVQSFGGYVNSSKSSVAPIQGKVNKTTPYRSI